MAFTLNGVFIMRLYIQIIFHRFNDTIIIQSVLFHQLYPEFYLTLLYVKQKIIHE